MFFISAEEMGFHSNLGRLREIGRGIVLPSREIKKVLSELLHSSEIISVIDFGAGTLYWSEWFAEKVNRVYAVDIIYSTSQPAVKSPNITLSSDFYVLNDIHQNSLFWICDVIHHLPVTLWNELENKVLKKFDYIVIKDINCHHKVGNFMNKLHDKIINGEKIHNVNPDIIIQNLKVNGFEVRYREIHRLWYPHFIIIGRRNT